MSGNRVNEVGTLKPLAANGNYVVPPGGLTIGFICNVLGSITIVDSGGTTLLAATAVTAGNFLAIPAECPIGATVTLSGGGAGSLIVA